MRRPALPLICTALGIAWSGVALAEGVSFIGPSVSAFESGVLCAVHTGLSREAPDTAAGTTHVVEKAPPFVSHSHRVPAVLGIGFGVSSGLDSLFGSDGVLISVSHPPFDGLGTTEQSYASRIGTTTDPSINFYQFDEAYELVLGEWVMTASLNQVTLWEVTFLVVPPAAMPELAGACGYLDLIG